MGVEIFSVRNGLLNTRYSECRVCFLMLEPELWMTIVLDGKEGHKALVKDFSSTGDPGCVHMQVSWSQCACVMTSLFGGGQ